MKDRIEQELRQALARHHQGEAEAANAAVRDVMARAFALHESGCYQDALDHYECIQKVFPGQKQVLTFASMILLLGGNFPQGLPAWENRPGGAFSGERPFAGLPLWDGHPHPGESILIHAEQGFGDSLMCCRFAEQVAARGLRPVLLVSPRLTTLMESVPGVGRAVDRVGPEDRDLKWQIPMMSLPWRLDLRVEAIPADVPYVAAPRDKLRHWQRVAGEATTPPRVGLCWHAKAKDEHGRRKCVELASLLSFLPRDGATYVSLQTGDGREQLAGADRPLADWGGAIEDAGGGFDDTAAAIESLDLVITVDTAVAHLAGALGKPVWILLQHVADWRWLLGRADSPWYPSACLFRQDRPGEWDRPLAALASVFQAFLSGRS